MVSAIQRKTTVTVGNEKVRNHWLSLLSYWSNESIAEWLLSVDNLITHQQLSSLKQTEFINLIIDETRDISVQQMICICLRYVEKNTGQIREEIFKLFPILDESGEGKTTRYV